MKSPYVSSSVTYLLILLPALALVTQNVTSILFYLLCLISIYWLMTANGRKGSSRLVTKPYAIVTIAFLLPSISVVATSLWHGSWNSSDFEKALRFTLAIPVLGLLLYIPSNRLKHIQWGFIAGAFAGSLLILWVMKYWAMDRYQIAHYGPRYNAVTFSDLTLLFGLCACLSLGWRLSHWPRLEAGLKVAAASLAMYSTLVSETRGSWIVVPMFAFLAMTLYTNWSVRRRIASLLLILCAMGLLGWEAPALHERLVLVEQNLNGYYETHAQDSSVGTRLQLWHAAYIMFNKEPLLGIGGGSNFSQGLQELAAKGVISPFTAANYGEPHNDYMLALADFGLLGSIAFLALYIIPIVRFYTQMSRKHPQEIRIAAGLGLLFCCGFAIFSLTELMFRGMRTVPIYSVMTMILFALADTAQARSAELPSGVTITSHT